MKTIVIDIGHYGKYNSGIIKGYTEAERMWVLGKKLEAKLKATGLVYVYLTRSDQTKDLSLGNRARVAISKKADLFISLHSNGVGSSISSLTEAQKKVKGVVVFYSVDQPQNREFAIKVSKVVADAMGTKVDRVATWESTKYPGEDYLTVIDVAQDGGIPKILLIEHGFHTNPDDCMKLMDDTILDKIAEAECKAFLSELGLSIPVKPRTPEVVPVVQPTPKPTNTVKHGVVTASLLNVRVKASILGKRIGTLKKNTKVEIIGSTNGWYKISYNKTVGYVSAKYIKLVQSL